LETIEKYDLKHDAAKEAERLAEGLGEDTDHNGTPGFGQG